jgi:putative acetyltransferase
MRERDDGAMKPRMQIAPANLPTDLPAIRQLFHAYAASLPIDLGYQGFDDELASLPGKYAPPQGALLIARDANTALGCVAMRPLPSSQSGEGVASLLATGGAAGISHERWSVCEMKRLYVAPEGRGMGLGKKLAQAIIEAARAAGHHEIRLDTLAHMREAQTLYRALGFVEIAPYYDTPIEGTVFMSLKFR